MADDADGADARLAWSDGVPDPNPDIRVGFVQDQDSRNASGRQPHSAHTRDRQACDIAAVLLIPH